MNTTTTTAAPQHTNYPLSPNRRPVVAAPRQPPVPRRRLGRIALGAALLVIAGAAVGGYLYHAAGFASTDDAYLEGDIHPISSRINGTVLRVLVEDNAHVVAGQPLVELDPADLQLAVQSAQSTLAQAQAGVTQTVAQVAQAEAGIATATANLAENAAQLKKAELYLHRIEALSAVSVGAATAQDLDNAQAAFDAAGAARQALVAAHTSAQAALAAARAQGVVAQAQVKQAEAALALAKLQVGYTIIRAPGAGRIAQKTVESGQQLQPGEPTMAVVNDEVWVVANFKENQLAHLRPGQPVEVEVDAIPGKIFTGTLQSFAPGTGAEFALLPPDNATGNFTKVVQRLPVKIVFTPGAFGPDAARLAPGLSVVANVRLRR